jgi:SulP family sulfate permease
VAVVAATLLFLTPLLYHLPQATLAAVIMMAVVSLVNFEALWHA